ncbi:nucleotidyltransferase [Saccharopolyspora erythraea NRRL 2338]|uniref:Mannose-1-phosphate guanyltransferase n=2 Tax=Saccharopolyspora erythraea TaxID=1836 RepID=A4FNL4_SACEN|nr:NDP-sugar synthase [Saccharopolyspora erythraea]EQD84043.1 GDP-mannose pyrophosphorylase [Saccharopolyspora erythraea D]PFG99277.1 nucleotidyltransferase [Saccharopolyspora erythraea NRRL 2338]QRK89218.1 NDP-sugar synthase [Saccharopolyspora erythraea]CAM05639.1 mannose-1-phosphate guanyltransferase [Saccharopolyspora erythraea NRRL 2338]
MSTEAVVLVGGQGMRLRPLTLSAPKPMLPTAGVPFLSHLLSRIREAGIRHVVLGTSYKAEVFAEYFGDGSAFDLELEYVVEKEPLDTAGAIRNVSDRLRADDVLVFNGDILSGLDLRELLRTHREAEADVTLHLVRVDDPRQFGCVPTDADGRVTAFLEKTDNPPVDQINAGCYVFRRPVIDDIPAGRPVSVERETFPGLLASGARVQGHVDDSYWLDIGTPAAFVRGSADVAQGRLRSAALPAPAGEAVLLDEVKVAADAAVRGGSTIGARGDIGSGARIVGSTLFDDVRVEAGAVVEHSVIGAGAVVGEGAVVRGAIIGDGVTVGAGCELLDGVRVWPGVELPPGGVRFSAD